VRKSSRQLESDHHIKGSSELQEMVPKGKRQAPSHLYKAREVQEQLALLGGLNQQGEASMGGENRLPREKATVLGKKLIFTEIQTLVLPRILLRIVKTVRGGGSTATSVEGFVEAKLSGDTSCIRGVALQVIYGERKTSEGRQGRETTWWVPLLEVPRP